MDKSKIKSFLSKHNIDNKDMYSVCRMFLVDRAQYPTRMPASWGAVAKAISQREKEFKNYVRDGIDFELMDELGLYGS